MLVVGGKKSNREGGNGKGKEREKEEESKKKEGEERVRERKKAERMGGIEGGEGKGG